jgi:molecular chaperone GrpE
MSDPRREHDGEKQGRRGGKSRRIPIENGQPLKESCEEVDLRGEVEAAPEPSDTAKLEHDALLDRYQRLAAEFDNYRKRQARDFNRLVEQGRKKLVTELLTVLDNFDRASRIAQGVHSDKEIVDGILQTSEQLRSVLKKEGLEEVTTREGDLFDPNIHEAMFAEDVEGCEADIVLEIYQKAYRFGQDLLRPARVKVGRVPGQNGG